MILYVMLAFRVSTFLPGVRQPLAGVEGVTTLPRLFASYSRPELALCFVIKVY